MTEPGRPRQFIALAAAYLIALQALLLPLSVVASAAPDFGLCAAGASVPGSQSPAGHQTGCPCAAGCGMQCGVHALAGPPQTLIAIDLTQVGAPLPLPAPAPVIRAAVRGPQLARGPPAA